MQNMDLGTGGGANAALARYLRCVGGKQGGFIVKPAEAIVQAAFDRARALGGPQISSISFVSPSKRWKLLLQSLWPFHEVRSILVDTFDEGYHVRIKGYEQRGIIYLTHYRSWR